MKLFFFFFLIFFPNIVSADNVDIKINILEDGTANIIEVWDVKNYGNSWCKTISYLDNIYVYYNDMFIDGERLTYRNYRGLKFMYGSLEYGGNFSYIDNRLNICFGLNSFGKHTYTLNYSINDYIYNINDGQVLYWTLLNNVTVDNVNIEVSSFYDFSDDLELWKYGFDGNVYVKDGKIFINNNEKLIDDYVVLLVKFPKNVFNTSDRIISYSEFDDYYQHASLGMYEDKNIVGRSLVHIILIVLTIIIFLLILIKKIVVKRYNKFINSYGYDGDKIIDIDNIPMFRDIPCDKDLYYIYVLIRLNRIGDSDVNILGAIILKWIKDKKIDILCVKKNKNNCNFIINLSLDTFFDNAFENKLFKMMYEASNNGKLEIKEFHDWIKRYDMKFLGLFAKMEQEIINSLKKDTHIYHRIKKEDCRYRYVMDDKIYQDSVKIYGFKKYLEEFSLVDVKEIMELHLWEDYLVFGALFGMTDKISKQLKELYPNIDDIDKYNLL